MNVLMMDFKEDEGRLMDLALRALRYEHTVRYWMNDPEHLAGKGLVEKVKEWRPSMGWADLIILSGNCDYPPGFAESFSRYPIFGTNPKAAELELDRAKGQQILQRYGVATLPYTVVSSAAKGIRYMVEQGAPYAIKPWGGTIDKSTTCTPRTVEDGVFLLQRMEDQGFKGELMLQEMVDGVEIGVSRFFGPSGWSVPIEESFEFKKFMNGDVGGNTGEMGTVIRHVRNSKLFDLLLEPLTDYLHLVHFVGDCNVNCIIDDAGMPWPLEFTMRLGWPDFCIRQEVMTSDPIQWMYDLLEGEDSLEVTNEVAVGVVMAHGDFPQEKDPIEEWRSFPIHVEKGQNHHFHPQQVYTGLHPAIVGGRVIMRPGMCTAGQYVGVVSGAGATVSEAMSEAYDAVGATNWPSNVMYRTDIGESLKVELPQLQKHGYAEGMIY